MVNSKREDSAPKGLGLSIYINIEVSKMTKTENLNHHKFYFDPAFTIYFTLERTF